MKHIDFSLGEGIAFPDGYSYIAIDSNHVARFCDGEFDYLFYVGSSSQFLNNLSTFDVGSAPPVLLKLE